MKGEREILKMKMKMKIKLKIKWKWHMRCENGVERAESERLNLNPKGQEPKRERAREPKK